MSGAPVAPNPVEAPRSRKTGRQWRSSPCMRCGGDCPRHAILRELTVPMYVMVDDPAVIAALPLQPHTGGTLVTHFYTCPTLDEPALVGFGTYPVMISLSPLAEMTNGTVSTGTYNVNFSRVYAPKPSWVRRILRLAALRVAGVWSEVLASDALTADDLRHQERRDQPRIAAQERIEAQADEA